LTPQPLGCLHARRPRPHRTPRGPRPPPPRCARQPTEARCPPGPPPHADRRHHSATAERRAAPPTPAANTQPARADPGAAHPGARSQARDLASSGDATALAPRRSEPTGPGRWALTQQPRPSDPRPEICNPVTAVGGGARRAASRHQAIQQRPTPGQNRRRATGRGCVWPESVRRPRSSDSSEVTAPRPQANLSHQTRGAM
jgi:hypothetical protein